MNKEPKLTNTTSAMKPMRPFAAPIVGMPKMTGKRPHPEESISQQDSSSVVKKTPEQEQKFYLILKMHGEINESESLLKYLDENPLIYDSLIQNE